MLIGVMSDTHSDRVGAIRHIVEIFKKAGVKEIAHCGDINFEHLDTNLFAGIPVVCALTEDQIQVPEFSDPPVGFRFTRPKNRVCTVGDIRVYVGHKRSFEFLTGSEAMLAVTLNKIRMENDRVNLVFSGHTHHQIFDQGNVISFLNPGAVENSLDGYEYAIVDSVSNRVVFGRIPKVKPTKPQFQVGVISDSLNVSELDENFWEKLAEALRTHGVKTIIHCGNVSLSDIGRRELQEFQVHCVLRPDQEHKINFPENWHLISPAEPVVEVEGYRFYVQLDLGGYLIAKSEVDMYDLSVELRRKYPEITFVLCGFTYSAFYEEGELVRIINPGDVVNDRNFAVIRLPTTEVIFDHILPDKLPPLV